MKQRFSLKVISIGIGLIGVIIIVAVLGTHHGKHGQPSTTAVGSPPAPPATAVIEITPTGFEPKTLAVSQNTDVIWVNEDQMPHLPAADPYPTHDSMPYLVAPKALGVNETYTFHVSKPETIRYHDDLEPTLTGTIIVK